MLTTLFVLTGSSTFLCSSKDKLILLFGDILNLLGERIREFCSKDEVYLISKKLEDNSEEDFYKWMIDSVNKIFIETTL